MAVPDSGPLRYRPEIDGLRAVAVTGVLLYHAGFTVSGRPFLPGGFLGVDVFFVISGYLIARIILSEIGSTGAFSLARFYERRARRILPMLFLVILVVFPIGWRLLLPEAFAELARSAAAALLFVSNFFFYFATTEYGAESSLLKPLLHTWSLGIEEQFYVLFPLFALALHRFAPRGVLAGFLGVCLASFAAALYLDHRDPSLGFYSPLSRVWELLVGAMLAHAELRGTAPEAGRFARWTPAAALVVILASMLVAADEDGSPLIATVLTLAAVSAIVFFSGRGDPVAALLGSRPVVAVGLISYSVYLWHFPVFAFARIAGPFASVPEKIVAIVLVVALSAISYRVVEKPFRDRAAVSRRFVVGGALAAFLVLTGLSTAVIRFDGFPGRFYEIRGFLNFQRDNIKLRRQSWALVNRKREKGFDPGAKVKVLILGNSHAKDFFNALYLHRAEYPGYDFYPFGLQIGCFDRENIGGPGATNFFSSPEYRSSDILIVSTRYQFERCDEAGGGKGADDIEGLTAVASRARSDGKGVVVVGNTVEFGDIGGRLIADYEFKKAEDSGDLDRILIDPSRYRAFMDDVNRKYFARKARKAELNQRIAAVAAALGAAYVDRYPMICDEASQLCFGLTPDGHKALFDYGHFTLDGARFFGARLLELGIRDVLARAYAAP